MSLPPDVVLIEVGPDVVIVEAPLAPADVVLVVTEGQSTTAVVNPPPGPPPVIIAETARGPSGVQGAPGPPGPPGDTGPPGPRGFQGPQGDAGLPGPVGPQGDLGIVGPQGPQGAPSTVAGPIGPQGPQGQTGLGAAGPQGPPGVQGAAGVSNVPGPQGPQGVVGAQGPASVVPGPIGPQGPQGNTGLQGPVGVGAQGPTGATGPQGPVGVGAQGPQGPQGPSLFIIASNAPSLASTPVGAAWWDLDNGRTFICYDDGSSKQWVEFIGATGPQGPIGVGSQGPQGAPGTPGTPGASATPAAPLNAIQFNNAGAFGGSVKLQYTGTQLLLDTTVGLGWGLTGYLAGISSVSLGTLEVNNGTKGQRGRINLDALYADHEVVAGTLTSNGDVNANGNGYIGGNLAIGATQRAWAATGISAIDIGATGHLRSGGTSVEIGSNLYYDGAWKYKQDGAGITIAGVTYLTNPASFVISMAPPGTAGAAATPVQKLGLDASGNLSIAGVAGIVGVTNFLVDGSCQVSQSVPDGSTRALTTTPAYSTVDVWQAWVSGGPVGTSNSQQGNFNQATAQKSLVLNLSAGVTEVTVRQRIEGARTRSMANRTGIARTITSSFSALVYQNSGANASCTLVLSRPNALDDYTGVTAIATTTAFVVPSGVATTIAWPGMGLGDVSNGLQVDLKAAFTTTPSTIFFTDMQLCAVAAPPVFVPRVFTDELRDVQRFYWKTFPYAVVPGQGVGSAGACVNYDCFQNGAIAAAVATPYWTSMRIPTAAMPAGSVTLYSPNILTANWYNASRAADSGIPVTGGSDRYLFLRNPQVAADSVGQPMRIHAVVDVRMPVGSTALYDLRMPASPMLDEEGNMHQPADYLARYTSQLAVIAAALTAQNQ